MYGAFGQVGSQVFKYDQRTGQETETAQGEPRFFKDLSRVNFVMCNGNEFTIKLTTKFNMPSSEFVGIDPVSGVFFDITYDPRVIIPAILTSPAYAMWCEMNPSAFKVNCIAPSRIPTSQPSSQAQPAEGAPAGALYQARCCVSYVTFTYNTQTGKEIYAPETHGTASDVAQPIYKVVSVERRETRFLIGTEYLGATHYDSVKYNATNDTFEPGMRFDPRIVIPAIRASPAFIEIFGETLEPHVSEFGQPPTAQTLNKYGLNRPAVAAHVKYVDIGDLRVVYDARTGEEIDSKVNGIFKSALYVDNCISLFRDDYEFMVTFTADKEEHMCRVVYDYNTGLFSGLTADPRIIIPYVRSSPEFKAYIIPDKIKKLTNADVPRADLPRAESANPMVRAIRAADSRDDKPEWTDPEWDNKSAWDDKSAWDGKFVWDDKSAWDKSTWLAEQPYPTSWAVIDEPRKLDVPRGLDVPRDTQIPRALNRSSDIYQQYIDQPPTPTGPADQESPPGPPTPTREGHGIEHQADYNTWMHEVLGNEIENGEVDPEIRRFDSLDDSSQQNYLLKKIDIIRTKLQARRSNLMTMMTKRKLFTDGIVIEPQPPAAKFTPRENNLQVDEFDIREHQANQADQAEPNQANQASQADQAEPNQANQASQADQAEPSQAEQSESTQKLLVDRDVTVEHADIGAAELVQSALPTA